MSAGRLEAPHGKDLDSLGTPQSTWYVLAAEEAHERHHVGEWMQAFAGECQALQTAIEGLQTPYTPGMTVEQATNDIRALTAFQQALQSAWSTASSAYLSIPEAAAHQAERVVVDPLILSICNHAVTAVTSGWTMPCTPPCP